LSPPEFDGPRREVSGIHPVTDILVGDQPLRIGELMCRLIGERIEIEGARQQPVHPNSFGRGAHGRALI
jgi:hypothetical protein